MNVLNFSSLASTLVKSDRFHNSVNSSSVVTSIFSKRNCAVVSQPIYRGYLGRIYYEGTYWFGYTEEEIDIPEGTVVEVIKRQGTTWLVKPVEKRQIAPENKN